MHHAGHAQRVVRHPYFIDKCMRAGRTLHRTMRGKVSTSMAAFACGFIGMMVECFIILLWQPVCCNRNIVTIY